LTDRRNLSYVLTYDERKRRRQQAHDAIDETDVWGR
jgi:hypothetical protein